MLTKLFPNKQSLGIKGLVPLISKGLGMLAGYANIWLITNYFGAESLGAFSFLSTVINLTALLSMTGMDTFLLKQGSIFYGQNEHSKYAGLIVKVLMLSIIQAAFAGLLFSIFSTDLSRWLNAPNYNLVFDLMVVILPIYITFYLLNEGQRTRGNNTIYSISHHGYGFFTLLILGAGIWLGVEYKLFPFWSFIGASWLLLILAVISTGKVFKIKANFSLNTKEIRQKAFPFFLVSSVTVLLNWSDVLMLRFLTNEIEVAAYHTIYRLGLLITLPLIALNTILPARFASLFAAQDKSGMSSLAKSSVRISSVGSVLIFAGVLLVLPLVLSFLEIPQINLQLGTIILGIGYVLGALMGPNGSFLMMVNQEKLYSVILGVTTVINIVLNLILIHFYGFLGAALATSICIIIRNVWCVVYIKKSMGYTFWLH